MPRGPARFTVTLLLLASGLSAQQPAAKPQYSLAPTPKTIAWGYYDASTPPVLRVKSRDTVEVRTLITSSPKRLEGAGLPANQVEQPLRDIYDQVKDKGPGGHILTGPIYIGDAHRFRKAGHSIRLQRLWAGTRLFARGLPVPKDEDHSAGRKAYGRAVRA